MVFIPALGILSFPSSSHHSILLKLEHSFCFLFSICSTLYNYCYFYTFANTLFFNYKFIHCLFSFFKHASSHSNICDFLHSTFLVPSFISIWFLWVFIELRYFFFKWFHLLFLVSYDHLACLYIFFCIMLDRIQFTHIGMPSYIIKG